MYEGKRTENAYFTNLSIKKNIELIDCGDSPMCKAERLNRLVVDKGYKGNFNDEKIYVLDFDIVESDGHKNNIYDYLDSKFVVYYSNPCFELWLLYHFENDIKILTTIKKEDIVSYSKSNKYLDFKGIDDKDLTDDDITNLNASIENAINTSSLVGVEYKVLTKSNLDHILKEINLTNLDVLLKEISV